MPAPATIDEFLDLVRKSGVLDEKRLDAYLAKAARRRRHCRRSRPSSPACMVRDGLLTHFQAEQFLPGQMAPLHHRQVQGARTARLRRHGQRLPVRTQAHAPPGGRQGAARPPRPTTPPRWSASTARPAPSPPSTIPTSSAPTTSTRTTSCTSWSWSTWTAPACRRSSRQRGPMDVAAGRPLHPPGGPGPAARPRGGRPGPSRHQAGQHPGGPQRHRQDPRHGPGPLLPRRGRHPHQEVRRERAGHGRLPGPRTGPRQPRRRHPGRHLQPGRDVLLPADRPAARSRRARWPRS